MQTIPVKGHFGLPRFWLWRRAWLLLLIPVLAVGVQPLVNMLMTGSLVASGNAAKSLFGIIPSDLGVIAGRILSNFMRMWREFLTGYLYVFAMALIGLAVMLRDKRFRLPALMILFWLLAGTAAISTLDTAFWHFKRYQMPLIALFFPLAGWGWAFVYTRLRRRMRRIEPSRLAFVLAVFGVLIAISISSLLYNTLDFLSDYALNVGYVVAQPLQMARWLAANTPEDAHIAVHDVGMMRYIGGRTTIDIVGLTTPYAAAYWRNGPGSVGEFIEKMRPDYIASYGEGHGLGLGYLQHTALYADTLASYTVSLDPVNNVSLAAPTQGYLQTQLGSRGSSSQRAGAAIRFAVFKRNGSCGQHQRRRHRLRTGPRLPMARKSASRRLPDRILSIRHTLAVALAAPPVLQWTGGGCINGEELFMLTTTPGKDLILVTRLHPVNAGTFDVYANDQLIGTRVIPALPGAWLEVPTLIPAAIVTDAMRIRIVPHVSGDYMPYYHWAYQGNPYQPVTYPGDPLATFESGAIRLYQPDMSTEVTDSGEQRVRDQPLLANRWYCSGRLQDFHPHSGRGWGQCRAGGCATGSGGAAAWKLATRWVS